MEAYYSEGTKEQTAIAFSGRGEYRKFWIFDFRFWSTVPACFEYDQKGMMNPKRN